MHQLSALPANGLPFGWVVSVVMKFQTPCGCGTLLKSYFLWLFEKDIYGQKGQGETYS